MRVLAVDTTTLRGSVAVVSAGGVLAEARVSTSEGHSRWLLPAVDALLGGLGLAAATLDAFAVTTGPGAFTGLRVGMSSVQGLALAAGRPCVGLCTLDVLALAAAGRGEPVVVVMDAFRGEVYAGVYDGQGRRLGPPRVGALEEMIAGTPRGAAFVGDAATGGRRRIEAGVPDPVFPEIDLYLASALGRAALDRVASGETTTAADLRPLYLRGADARAPRP